MSDTRLDLPVRSMRASRMERINLVVGALVLFLAAAERLSAPLLDIGARIHFGVLVAAGALNAVLATRWRSLGRQGRMERFMCADYLLTGVLLWLEAGQRLQMGSRGVHIPLIFAGTLYFALGMFGHRIGVRTFLKISSRGLAGRLSRFRRFDYRWTDIQELDLTGDELVIAHTGGRRRIDLRLLTSEDHAALEAALSPYRS